jgi:hypothetical protein
LKCGRALPLLVDLEYEKKLMTSMSNREKRKSTPIVATGTV